MNLFTDIRTSRAGIVKIKDQGPPKIKNIIIKIIDRERWAKNSFVKQSLS